MVELDDIAAVSLAGRHVVEQDAPQRSHRDVIDTVDAKRGVQVLECGIGRCENGELAVAVQLIDEPRSHDRTDQFIELPGRGIHRDRGVDDRRAGLAGGDRRRHDGQGERGRRERDAEA